MKSRIKKTGDAAQALRTQFARVYGAHVKVGVLGDKVRHESKASPVRDTITNVELAVIHEFGAPSAGIPERSFIRAGVRHAMPRLKMYIVQTTPKILRGEVSYERGLSALGLIASSEIKQIFTTWPYGVVALAPSTIARKGSGQPLIDTAQLRASVTYEVVNE